MTEVFRIWCEWDIGQDYQVFSSQEKAMDWLQENLNLQEVMHENEYENLDKVFDLGLVSIESSLLD